MPRPERPSYSTREVANLLRALDFGSSIAEQDRLLESARVETSAFADLLNDRVDLVPGTKGSGKSALYRIFVEFLSDPLFADRRVIVAHGSKAYGDPTFHAYQEEFEKLSEDDFVTFWCVYLISLVRDQFLLCNNYDGLFVHERGAVGSIVAKCRAAKIPPLDQGRSLSDVIAWALVAVSKLRPVAKYRIPDETWLFTVDSVESEPPDDDLSTKQSTSIGMIPSKVAEIKYELELLLDRIGHSLWLMVDRLDELFARRSAVETRALRGLLRTLRIFESPRIRVKVFLRDDILSQVSTGDEGFTALTHITARQADTLRWSEEQIMSMVVRRFAASPAVAKFLGIDKDRINASREYREACFYRIFPPKVHSGENQSSTLRWIYNHVADGNRVVTPRDVIDLLERARQRQVDDLSGDLDGSVDCLIGSNAIRYGLEQLSLRKRDTYLKAEFPHFWSYIERFIGGKTEFDDVVLEMMFGKDWKKIVDNLVGIGVLEERRKYYGVVYRFPFVYRYGLELTQGQA